MARIVSCPAELRFEPKKQHWPLVSIAAFGADGILVMSGQRTNRCTGMLFDLALQSAKATVSVAEGDTMDWQPRRLIALPDRRFLLCALSGKFPSTNQNLLIDGKTLEVTSASTLVGVVPHPSSNVDEQNPAARDLLFLGQKALLGHGSYYGNVDDYQWFTLLSPNEQDAPRVWMADLGKQVDAIVKGVASHVYVVRGAALTDRLILACQAVHRSGSNGHTLIAVDEAANVVAHRPDDRKRIRDATLQVEADRSKGHIYVYARGSLEIIDAELRTVAQAPVAHAFLKTFCLLASDGRGRLLWISARKKALLLTEAEDIRLDSLASSLDALYAMRVP
jgi:hypothetical protein